EALVTRHSPASCRVFCRRCHARLPRTVCLFRGRNKASLASYVRAAPLETLGANFAPCPCPTGRRTEVPQRCLICGVYCSLQETTDREEMLLAQAGTLP